MELVFAIGLVIAVIVGVVAATQSSSPSKFRQLGDMRGKLAQIIAVVGRPQSYSYPAPSKVLAQWVTSGFQIALLFQYQQLADKELASEEERNKRLICLGITNQFVR